MKYIEGIHNLGSAGHRWGDDEVLRSDNFFYKKVV